MSSPTEGDNFFSENSYLWSCGQNVDKKVGKVVVMPVFC